MIRFRQANDSKINPFKPIVFLLLLLVFIPSILAEDPILYESGQVINLKFTCRFDQDCTQSSQAFIWVFYPNQSLFINGSELNKNFDVFGNLSYFDYSLPNTSIMGDYSAIVKFYEIASGPISGTFPLSFTVGNTITGLHFGICPISTQGQVSMWAIAALLIILFILLHIWDFLGLLKTFTSLAMIIWSINYHSCEPNISMILTAISVMILLYSVIFGGVFEFFKLVFRFVR